MDKQDIIDGLDVILGRRGEKITQGDILIVEAAIMALAQRPEARAQEPVAWAVYDEPTEELIDVTLVKPDGGEPGLRYEPLYMNSRHITEEKP